MHANSILHRAKKKRFLSWMAILSCLYGFDWPLVYWNVSCLIFWSDILEKCTENVQWPCTCYFWLLLHEHRDIHGVAHVHMYVHCMYVCTSHTNVNCSQITKTKQSVYQKTFCVQKKHLGQHLLLLKPQQTF